MKPREREAIPSDFFDRQGVIPARGLDGHLIATQTIPEDTVGRFIPIERHVDIDDEESSARGNRHGTRVPGGDLCGEEGCAMAGSVEQTRSDFGG